MTDLSAPDRPRAARCQVLDITRRGVNRCENEAIDPAGEILICAVHLGAALALAGRQDGIAITLTGPPPRSATP